MTDKGPSNALPSPQRRPADERRLVTIIFADLAGFTSLAEHLDPEEVQDLLNRCFNRLVPCVERYGGTIDKFIGDGLMALFGAPVAHERDPERAIRAAMDMRSSLAEFNHEQGLDLAVHIGINTGHVLAGSVGSTSRQDYSVVGDAVNVASRLEDMSEPNEILIGPWTNALAGPVFQTEEAGTFTLRGRTDRVQVHRVLETAPMSRAQVVSRLHSPMVGRDREFTILVDALERLVKGEGSLVYVLGDAGLGKSRLLSEARQTGPARKVAWLEGQAVFMGKDLSYGPIKQILELDAGLIGVPDPSQRLARLKDRLAELMPDDHNHQLTPIAALLGLLSETALQDWYASSGGALAHERLQEALFRHFERLATRHPLVLVLEDCHWIDASSAAFVECLLPLVEKTPLLLCLVARPKSESGFLSPEQVTSCLESRYEEIRISKLDRNQSRHLAIELLGSTKLPTGLGAAIERQADGNPFFIQEILRSLIESGGIETDGRGGWRLTGRLIPKVPDTLEAMIMARIDRLPEHSKRILRPASIVGDSFPETLILPLTELSQTELKRNLQYLENSEIIRSLATSPHPEFAFVHALIRDAVYDSLPARDRRALHARVAEGIESSHARLDGHYALLAHHYAKAERWGRARDYLLKAADSAGKLGASEEADYYAQALNTLLMSHRDDIARAIHEAYVAANKDLIDRNDTRALPWDDLPDVYRESNRRQADSHTVYLESVGCGFAPAEDDPPCRVELTHDEVEFLAQREHERWWSRKRSTGYVFGPERSDAERTHPSMLPWEELSEDEREKDRQAVRDMPKRFADAGFQTYRVSREDS